MHAFARSVCNFWFSVAFSRGASADFSRGLCWHAERLQNVWAQIALASLWRSLFGALAPPGPKMQFRAERLEFSMFWCRFRVERLENHVLGWCFRAERLQFLFFGGVFARSVCKFFSKALLARGASAKLLSPNRSRLTLALTF